MIHAYLVRTDREDEGEYGLVDGNNCLRSVNQHGPNYIIQMNAINEAAKLNITVSLILRDSGNFPSPFFWTKNECVQSVSNLL